MPLISVITICRNMSQRIRVNLASASAQTRPDLFEHWVIDGASSDGTQEIVRSFPHARLDSRVDGGISDAFNRGVQKSAGEWLLFLNADDAFASPDVVESMAKELDSSFDFVYGRVALMDETLQNCVRVWGDENGWRHLGRRQTVPHPSLFAHRRMFEKYGLFDLSFRVNMDYDWLLRSYQRARYRFVPVTVTLFRTGGASTSDGSFRQAKECWRAKTKNGVGTWWGRAAWFLYQGSRSFLDSRLPGIPLLGPVYARLTAGVRKSY